jgi:sarcosine oxidase, subunit gamma
MPEAPSAGSCWRTTPPFTRFALRVSLQGAAQALASPAAGIPLATTACRSAMRGDWVALWLGPDEQLLLGAQDGAEAFRARLAMALQGIPHSLVDISHRQVAIDLSGPHAAALINTGCPLDLDLTAFPVGACTRTVFARADIVLWRRGVQEFHVETWRSFAPYVTGLLAKAEVEFMD